MYEREDERKSLNAKKEEKGNQVSLSQPVRYYYHEKAKRFIHF